MRSWAQWTAKTLMLTAGFAAAGTGLTGAAFAQATSGPVTSGNGSIGGGNQVIAPITAPVNVCGSSVAVLGDSAASCEGMASVGAPGRGHKPPVRHRCGCQAQPVRQDMIAPVLPGGPGLPPVFWAMPWRPVVSKAARPAPRSHHAAGHRAQVAVLRRAGARGGLKNAGLTGLGTLSAESGLPSAAGLSGLPALGSAPGAGELMPSSVLSAASTSGMGTTSFFTLAAGALLAGVSALNIAGRPGSGGGGQDIRKMGMPA